jgi:histidine ammonia-lyase
LRLRDLRPDPDLPVGRAFALADSLLDAELADRPLTDDVKAAAGELLDRCTDLWNTGLTGLTGTSRDTGLASTRGTA